MNLSPAIQNDLLRLAASVVRGRVLGRKIDRIQAAARSDPAFARPAGCFVSLHSLPGHELRGCVGQVEPSPVGKAVASSAAAVLDDPRFASRPVEPHELDRLAIEISLLSPLRTMRDSTDFDPLDEGIHIAVGEVNGCFLPQVARETGWTRRQLLERLCREKLRLPVQIVESPEAQLSAFKVQVIGPVPLAQVPRGED